jgi:hypothetical protein
VTPDQVSQLLQAVAGLSAHLEDVLRRLDKIEERWDAGDRDVARRLGVIEAAMAEGDRKRDAAREAAQQAHTDILARLEAVEKAQEAAAAVGRWRWSAWQVLAGLVAVAGGLIGIAVAIADRT